MYLSLYRFVCFSPFVFLSTMCIIPFVCFLSPLFHFLSPLLFFFVNFIYQALISSVISDFFPFFLFLPTMSIIPFVYFLSPLFHFLSPFHFFFVNFIYNGRLSSESFQIFFPIFLFLSTLYIQSVNTFICLIPTRCSPFLSLSTFVSMPSSF